jgi:hypothetical protein
MSSYQAAVHALPRELVHIVAQFVPLDVVQLIRADRTLFERFASWKWIWLGAVLAAQHNEEGASALERCAPALLARCPALASVLPRRLSDKYPRNVSPDGKWMLYGEYSVNEEYYCDVERLFISSVTGEPSTVSCLDVEVNDLNDGASFSCDVTLLVVTTEESLLMFKRFPPYKSWYLERDFNTSNVDLQAVIVAYYPNLLVFAGTKLMLWNARTELRRSRVELLAERPMLDLKAKLAASPFLFAVGGRTVQLLEPENLQVRAELVADYPLDIEDLKFSSDGARLVSVGQTTRAEVIVWDVLRAQQLHILRVEGDFFRDAAISNQGLVVLSIKLKQELRVYRCGDPEDRMETLVQVKHAEGLIFAEDEGLVYFQALPLYWDEGWFPMWRLKVA